MTSAEQRRSSRYPADWSARYRLGTDDDWRNCRVIDVSLDGAALELDGATPAERLAGRIHLQIGTVAGDHVGVTIRGLIRRHVLLRTGRLMVGVEFGVLRAEERNLLHLLVGLRAEP